MLFRGHESLTVSRNVGNRPILGCVVHSFNNTWEIGIVEVSNKGTIYFLI